MAKKLMNLSGENPKEGLKIVDCTTCNKTGMIGSKKCPMCNGVGQMTKAKARKLR